MITGQNNPQRKNPLKEEFRKSLEKRVAQYVAQKNAVSDYVRRNPDAPQKQKKQDKEIIATGVKEMERIFDEILPYILKVKGRVPNVLDKNKITASYLLFGKISQSWKALFLLAKEGFHYEVMELLRSIRESADLIFLFMNGDDTSPDLQKWFGGEIVSNEKARSAMSGFVNGSGNLEGVKLPVEAMKAGIYGGLSKYTHISYGALLDSYNVFTDDFDFERVSGFHYTKESSLPYAAGEMRGTILALKYFSLNVKDGESYNELDEILKHIAPEIYDKEKIKKLTEYAIKRYS